MGLRFIGIEDTDLEVINYGSGIIIELVRGNDDLNGVGYANFDLETAKLLHLIIGHKIEEIIENNKIKQGENGK